MTYQLLFGRYGGVFALPAEAADRYINEASLDDFKVLLAVFRRPGGALDVERTAAELRLAPEALRRSLEFWERRGLFTLQSAAPAPAGAPDTSVPDAAAAAAVAGAPASGTPASGTAALGAPEAEAPARPAARRVIDQPLAYGRDEIAQRIRCDPEVRFLLESAQQQLGRPVSSAECSTLLYLHEGAGLPADVIAMLIGYCVSCGKGNLRYIERMAVGFAEEGVDTYDKAEARLRALEEKHSFEGQVRTALGISGRALTPTERTHLARWCGWKTPVELVKLAYDINVARTGKLSFSYMNSILASWHEKGISTVEAAKNENRRGRDGKKSAPSYDIDEYIRYSLKKLNGDS